jgi:hypothetical protein
LRHAEEIEISGTQVDRHHKRREDLETQRNRGGQLQPHPPVKRQPENGGEVHQAARENEQRLAQPHFLAVVRVYRRVAQTRDQPSSGYYGSFDGFSHGIGCVLTVPVVFLGASRFERGQE